jgi:hypothetical protein
LQPSWWPSMKPSWYPTLPNFNSIKAQDFIKS